MFNFIQNIFKRKEVLHTPRVVGGWCGCNMPSDVGLWLMSTNDYVTYTTGEGRFVVEPKNKQQKIFVLYSDIFEEKQISYKQHLHPYIHYIDSVLNSSATLNERLGTLIIGSPKNLSNAPTEVVLPKTEKDRLEKELSEDYGSLSRQKQIMLLPREMSWQTINLAGFDNKTYEKLNIAVMVIADALQVPANQVSLIDSFNSKAFSNGTELREGDFLKYATFERLLNFTLIRLANAMELKVDYTIYNKPVRTIEQ